MIRQNARQGKEPLFAALISRNSQSRMFGYTDSVTPTKRRDSESYYDVNQSRRPELSRNTSQDRLAASPLKGPLKKALEKTVNNMYNKENQMGTSRMTYESRVSRRHSNEENVDEILDQMHSETQNFLWKYFDPARLNKISMDKFVDNILKEYQNLWNTQQAEQILQSFMDKLVWYVGGDQTNWVNLKLLQMQTSEAGIIGLILKIFKQLQQQGQTGVSRTYNYSTLKQSFQQQLQQSSDIQNIKNIVQQFMQSMYKCMQNEVYAKFNVEMRRMVLRYKQSQKLLKIVNDKITNNIDIFVNDQKYTDKIKALEADIELYKEAEIKFETLYKKQQDDNSLLRLSNDQLLVEVRRLNDEIQRYKVSQVVQPTSTISYIQQPQTISQTQYYATPITSPTVVQLQKSTVRNGYSDFYNAPLTTTTIQNTSSVINPVMETSTYPTLVTSTQPQIKVQVIQQKEYITTSPSKSVIQTTPLTPSRIRIQRLQASPIRSRVIQLL